MSFFHLLIKSILAAMQSKIVFKSGSRRSLDISKRDTHAINALDRTKLKVIGVNLELLCAVIKAVKKKRSLRAVILKQMLEEYEYLLRVLIVNSTPRLFRYGSEYDLYLYDIMI